MKREVLIGLLALITIVVGVWGYNYVKGKNLLANTKTFYIVYDNVEQLTEAAPVVINGYTIGSVSNIELNPNNVKSILVTISVDGKINYSKNTEARLQNSSLVGGKLIALSFDEPCSGNGCAQTGDTLKARSVGLLESLTGVDNLADYQSDIKMTVGEVLDTVFNAISDPNKDNAINNSVRSTEHFLEELDSTTHRLNRLIAANAGYMTTTLKNIATLSNSLAESNDDLKATLSNVASLTDDLKNMDLSGTVNNANSTLVQTTALVQRMDTVALASQTTFAELNALLNSANQGEGTLAKLLNDPELYENMEELTTNFSYLLQDIRLNPKRYFTVLRKKSKQYTIPEDDPVFLKENEKKE